MRRRTVVRAGIVTLALALPTAAAWWAWGGPPRGGEVATAPMPDVRFEAAAEEGMVRVRAWTIDGAPLSADAILTVTLATQVGPLVARGRPDGSASEVAASVPWSRAGAVAWRAQLGDRSGQGTFEIVPGPAVAPLEVVPTDRTVRLDRGPDPMLLVLPRDRDGNVAAGPVRIRSIGPDGTTGQAEVPVRHQLAAVRVPAGDVVGTLRVVATIERRADGADRAGGDATAAVVRGERAEIELVAGPPVTARLQGEERTALAAGRDVWRIALADGRDAEGRVPQASEAVRLDGAAATGAAADEAWHVWVVRPLVAGATAFDLVPPPAPGTVALRATGSDGAALDAAALDLQAIPLAAGLVPLRWLDASTLVVGPVVDPDGAYPDDGSAVTVRIETADGALVTRVDGVLRAGAWTATLPPLPAEAAVAVVDVAGRELRTALLERP